MLKFDGAWRFDSPGKISNGVLAGFWELISKIATQGDRQTILEHFKSFFGNAAGRASGWSSSESWAETDLDSFMQDASQNAPIFVEAFFDACASLHKSHPEVVVPDVQRINRVLAENFSGYEIRPPYLVTTSTRTPVVVPDRVASIDDQARELIQQSLKLSEELLSEGRDRQAVQEILWLLETVSTAFQGLDTDAGTVQGKYFNKIAEDLRRRQRGTTLEQVLPWVTTLHGYLSSPTGGGIRHGTNLRDGVAMQPAEAQLFCNLIRSYIGFLLAEHARLTRGPLA